MTAPRLRLAPDYVSSDGPLANRLAAAYGLTPDGWQASAVVDMLGRKADGKIAAPRVGVTVPRQNGKNAILEVVEVYKMAMQGRRVLHTAHEVKTAMQAFKRLLWFFDNPSMFPELAALVDGKPRLQNGAEAIFLTNGGSFQLVARSKGSGRGFSADDLICDEAQDLAEEKYAALMPIISASDDPQIILTGTPPSPKVDGAVWTRFRDAGVEGTDPRLCFLEWSADEGCDLDDRAMWAQANPALGERLTLDFTADERASMDDETFARERLGMWGTSASRRVISVERWAALANPESITDGPVAFAVAVSADEACASIGMAGWASDGRRQLEWITPPEAGVDAGPLDWLVPTAVAINKAQQPRCWIIDRTSTASRFVDPLRAAGCTVIEVGVNEYANACGTVLDEAKSGALVHLDQPTLNFALGVASKRSSGTEGKWRWQRRGSDADITPLDACTLAVHGLADGLKIAKPRTGRASFW
jgi:phage terminase large subunit-like protein